MKLLKKYFILCVSLLCSFFISCCNKEDRVKLLVAEDLKAKGIAIEKYEIEQSTISPAKQIALNDSAIWSLVPQWVQCIQLIDMEANQQYADPSAQEYMMEVGFIMANEYVDSINNRINQLDTTKTLGYEFLQEGRITMKNGNIQKVKFRIITDADVSKILLCTPIAEESERIIQIIKEAQHGNLTKLPVDPQKEMMYYLSTGKPKPSF